MSATPPDNKSDTDWFTWTMHLVFGLLVGAGVGLVIGAFMHRPLFSGRRWRTIPSDLISFDQIGIVMIGVALIVGGLASFKGNRLWFRPSIWDEAKPRPGPLARAFSVTLGVAGATMIAWAVISHLAGQSYSLSATIRPVTVLILVPVFAWVFFLYVMRSQSENDAGGQYVYWLFAVIVAISLIALVQSFFR